MEQGGGGAGGGSADRIAHRTTVTAPAEVGKGAVDEALLLLAMTTPRICLRGRVALEKRTAWSVCFDKGE